MHFIKFSLHDLLVFVEHRLWDGLATLVAVVVLGNLTQHLGRTAHCDDVGWDVLGYNGACSDDGVVADVDVAVVNELTVEVLGQAKRP